MEKDILTFNNMEYIYLKPKGEICNRLPAGSRVKILQRKGDWVKITWRGGKKKGWINPKLSSTADQG